MTTKINFDGSSCLAEGYYDDVAGELDLVFRTNGLRHHVYEIEPAEVVALATARSAGKKFHDLGLQGAWLRSYTEGE